MTDASNVLRLVGELQALPTWRGWHFSFEYPGFFCYQRQPFRVFFTPDDRTSELPIEVQFTDGRDLAASKEIAELVLVREDVRAHMATRHAWKVRDAAMDAISKVLAAAATS